MIRSRREAEQIVLEFVTTGVAAERLGVAPNVVGNWVKRNDSFPSPVTRLGKAAIYWWPEIKLWTELNEKD